MKRVKNNIKSPIKISKAKVLKRFCSILDWFFAIKIARKIDIQDTPKNPDVFFICFEKAYRYFLQIKANIAGMNIILLRNKSIILKEISVFTPKHHSRSSGAVNGTRKDVETTNTVAHKVFNFKKPASSGATTAEDITVRRNNPSLRSGFMFTESKKNNNGSRIM